MAGDLVSSLLHTVAWYQPLTRYARETEYDHSVRASPYEQCNITSLPELDMGKWLP
jgi:hypothetical protein